MAKMVENIGEKGENVFFFFFFPQCFQKDFFLGVIKNWDCLENSYAFPLICMPDNTVMNTGLDVHI